MFKVVDHIEVTWPVRVKLPKDGGEYEEQVFEGKFKILSQRESELHVGKTNGDKSLLDEALIGWDGVADPKGKPLTFNAKNKALLLGIPYVSLALVRAYFEATNGSLAKN